MLAVGDFGLRTELGQDSFIFFYVGQGEREALLLKAVKVRNNTKQNMVVKTERGNVKTGRYTDEIS